MWPGDVLLGIVATIGTVSLVPDRFDKLTGNCKIAIVRPHQIESEFLAAYFLSPVGQREIHRRARGTVQTGVILPDLKALPIPLLSDSVRDGVVEKVKAAYNRHKRSKVAYSEAETLLESVLGLDELDLTPQLFYERRYSEVEEAGRFDAEYYQPPKKAVLDALARMPGSTVGEQYRSIRQLWQPEKAEPGEYVRNYDLTDALQPFLDETVEPTTPDTIASTKKQFEAGDLVVSRLRSYLKEIAVVLNTGDVPMVGSSEFIVLRPGAGAIRVEALLVYLRSRYVQTVLKWCQDGSNHPRFDQKELLTLPVPDVVCDNQEEITDKVKESITARREARQLLEEAKTMVEKAILGG
jgi:type I restriction enzyme S subunit